MQCEPTHQIFVPRVVATQWIHDQFFSLSKGSQVFWWFITQYKPRAMKSLYDSIFFPSSLLIS